jgi:hypothetical protein
MEVAPRAPRCPRCPRAPVLRPIITRSYQRVAPNILIAGARLRPGSLTSFANPWTGAFRLYDDTGTPVEGEIIMDGKRLGSRAIIRRGDRRLTADVEGKVMVYLLPDDARGKRLPVVIDAVGLYADVYQ